MLLSPGVSLTSVIGAPFSSVWVVWACRIQYGETLLVIPALCAAARTMRYSRLASSLRLVSPARDRHCRDGKVGRHLVWRPVIAASAHRPTSPDRAAQSVSSSRRWQAVQPRRAAEHVAIAGATNFPITLVCAGEQRQDGVVTRLLPG